MIWWISKHIFCCLRRTAKYLDLAMDNKPPEIPQYKLPWVWIGYENLSITDAVNSSISYDQRINKDFLNKLSGKYDIQWTFIDSQTLEIKDFPNEGFIIKEDDS
jgi:hypothetical protein